MEEVEARACIEGPILASEWCHQQAILATDNKSIATVLATRDFRRSQLKFILEELLMAGGSLPAWEVCHLRRESNGVAHELAPLAKPSEHGRVALCSSSVC